MMRMMKGEFYMAVTFVPGNPPTYLFRTSDLTSGSVINDTTTPVGYIGAVGIDLDTNEYYRVTADKTVEKIAQTTIEKAYNFTGGSMIVLNGTSVNVSLPTGTVATKIAARVGDVYYEINPTNGSASGSSSGFVAQNMMDIVPVLSNYTSLAIIGGSSVAHLQHFKQVK